LGNSGLAARKNFYHHFLMDATRRWQKQQKQKAGAAV
jgi:hypothetical protein